MKVEWHPSQGFHTLVNQLEEGLLYGAMIGEPIADKQVVDNVLICTKRCGLLSMTYGEWLEKMNKSFKQFKTFWKKQCNLLRKTSQTAGQYSYGDNAVQSDDDQSFE